MPLLPDVMAGASIPLLFGLSISLETFESLQKCRVGWSELSQLLIFVFLCGEISKRVVSLDVDTANILRLLQCMDDQARLSSAHGVSEVLHLEPSTFAFPDGHAWRP